MTHVSLYASDIPTTLRKQKRVNFRRPVTLTAHCCYILCAAGKMPITFRRPVTLTAHCCYILCAAGKMPIQTISNFFECSDQEKQRILLQQRPSYSMYNETHCSISWSNRTATNKTFNHSTATKKACLTFPVARTQKFEDL